MSYLMKLYHLSFTYVCRFCVFYETKSLFCLCLRRPPLISIKDTHTERFLSSETQNYLTSNRLVTSILLVGHHSCHVVSTDDPQKDFHFFGCHVRF